MIFASHLLVISLLVATNNAAQLHRFHNGDCPRIEPMSGFQIDRFLGKWYVLENANENSNVCVQEEFNVSQEEIKSRNEYEMFDMARNELENSEKVDDNESHAKMEKVYYVKRSYLPFGARQFINETGKVKFLSKESQSELEINFPYTETGMLNMRHYEIISTDYDKYALVWRCQKTIFGHRRSAQMMSRYPTLEGKSMEELKSLLKHFEDKYEIKFLPVRQTDCFEMRKPLADLETPVEQPNKKADKKPAEPEAAKNNKRKLINIDIGGFHLSISYPFW